MTLDQRDALRKNWREIYQNYMKMRSGTLTLLLNPEATAEHIMRAKEMLCSAHKHAHEVQASLNQLQVLRFHDPQLPGV